MGEAVGLQLEGEYRSRLAAAHAAVKKRLDYQVETANVLRRMEQKHMVDWIIGNVKASITPDQEAAALKKCISDLKALFCCVKVKVEDQIFVRALYSWPNIQPSALPSRNLL